LISAIRHRAAQPDPAKGPRSCVLLLRSGLEAVRETERFDVVVIGSGFCALAFVDPALKRDPHIRILVLERGPFFLPEHSQNLPLPYQHTLGGLSETFPWTLSAKTAPQPPGQIICWMRPSGQRDPTPNVLLQVLANEADRETWDVVDAATLQMLEAVLLPKGANAVEYLHGAPNAGEWRSDRPNEVERRVPALVHEGSPLWIYPDEAAGPVRADYRPQGVENVYVTGAALWPKSGFWNPTLTMAALAQDLADQIVGERD